MIWRNLKDTKNVIYIMKKNIRDAGTKRGIACMELFRQFNICLSVIELFLRVLWFNMNTMHVL